VEEGKDALKKKGRVFVKVLWVNCEAEEHKDFMFLGLPPWVRNLSEFSYVLREASLVDVHKLYILVFKLRNIF
jgi:hypothetical protein